MKALTFRKTPETFRVEECPLFLPSGEGEHLYLWVEHRGWGTRRLLQHLQKALGLREVQVGHAGLKDARATARQWISLQGVTPEEVRQALEHTPVRLMEVHRHRHKLRVGKLRGNRFSLRLPGLDPSILERIRREGVPNRFGLQRFRGDAVSRGRALLRTGRAVRGRRARFVLSAYQAWWFNQLLSLRLKEGTWNRVLPGEVVRRGHRGSFWRVEDPVSLPPDVWPAGLLPGARTALAGGHPGALERELLAREGWREEDLRAWPVRGTRRPFVLPVQDLAYDGEWLTFTLPPGGYATVVLEALGVRWVEDAAL